MNRKSFIQKVLIGAIGMVAARNGLGAKHVKPEKSTYDKLIEEARFVEERIGYNHLPNKETRTMKTVLHKADSRGHANHGWLDSHHTFSFANYHNPERVHFGVLRVLNDDVVAPGRGFGTHPHDNMEIISIPLEGDLEHKDSMGNVAVIKKGDVQVMSAGTGIYHSEYNKSQEQYVKFLQIWIFPDKKNVKPRYDQITLDETKMKNNLYQVLSPEVNDEGVWIHQNAWFHIGNLDSGKGLTYELKDRRNGVYAFVLDGSLSIGDQSLNKRDGFGMWDVFEFDIKADSDARILLMEVPMSLN